MEVLDIALLACVPCVLTMLFVTSRKGRTAPSAFGLMVLLAVILATGLARGAPGEGFSASMTMLTSAFGLILASFVAILYVVLSAPLKHGYTDNGTDFEAILKACRIQDDTRRTLDLHADGRRRMPFLARLKDSFVTTDEEARIESVKGLHASVIDHLVRIVPAWLAIRSDELIDRAGTRDVLTRIEERLIPLATTENAARQVHGLAVDAMRSLDAALSSLSNARTCEILDAVSSNKGVAVMSTAANSSASISISTARNAVVRLSEGTSQAISAHLIAPDDTLDFIIDMAFDSAFDFMSFYSLSKISEAEDRCHAARDRVARMERDLRDRLEISHRAAESVREEIARFRSPYEESAFAELPAAAREYVPGMAER